MTGPDFRNMSPSEYQKWYSDHAPNYPYLDDFSEKGPHWHRTVFIMNHLEPGSQILDCGCSNGGLAKYITEHIPCEYTGIDIAPFFVKNTKINAPLANAYACPVEDMPFKDGYFDYVIAGEVLEHVLDLKITLKEILRVMKRGGELLITTPRNDDPNNTQHVRYLGPKELQEVLPGINVQDGKYSWLSYYSSD